MTQTCVVPKCKTGKEKFHRAHTKRSLFLPPKARAKDWMRLIPRKTYPTGAWRVCECHFEPWFIDRTYKYVLNGKTVEIPRGRAVLLKNAVPTLFPGQPAYFKKLPKPHKERTQPIVQNSKIGIIQNSPVVESSEQHSKAKIGSIHNLPVMETSQQHAPTKAKIGIVQNLPGMETSEQHAPTKVAYRSMLCGVTGCRHHSAKTNDSKIVERSEMKKVVFYGFPKDDYIRSQWIVFCGKPLTWKTGRAHICSDHFQPEDYVGRCIDNHKILKKDAVPSQKVVPVEKGGWKVVIPLNESNICSRELRKIKKIMLPQLQDLQKSGIDKSVETQLDSRDYRGNGGLNFSNDTVDTEHCPKDETCFQIVCSVTTGTVKNPPQVSFVSPVFPGPSVPTVSSLKESLVSPVKRPVSIVSSVPISTVSTRGRKRRDPLYILKSEHLKQIEELKKANTTLARRFAALQTQCLYSRKEIDQFEENLHRVFTKNQVDMLLVRKSNFTWTSEELDSFVKLSRKLSKSAYLSLIQDMKLPFPCVTTLEKFSSQHYPGLPIFCAKTNEETDQCMDFEIVDDPGMQEMSAMDFAGYDEIVVQEKMTIDRLDFSGSAIETIIVNVDIPFIKAESG